MKVKGDFHYLTQNMPKFAFMLTAAHSTIGELIPNTEFTHHFSLPSTKCCQVKS